MVITILSGGTVWLGGELQKNYGSNGYSLDGKPLSEEEAKELILNGEYNKYLSIKGISFGLASGFILYYGDSINNPQQSWYNEDGSINYPPNNGAVQGTQENLTLQKGSIFGRYGNSSGTFGTEVGTSIDKLSLPPNANTSFYHEYQVIKPITNVERSVIAPWGGSSGGGLQFKFPMSIDILKDNGYIIQIK